MSDDIEKEGQQKPEETKPAELSNEDLEKASGGAFNGFVNFGDIKGESTDKDHKDWIQILPFRQR